MCCFTHLRNNLVGWSIILCLVCVLAFNLTVIGLCEFVTGADGNLRLGVFQYSLSFPGSPYDTGGSCKGYGGGELEDLPAVKTSQVCAVLAPIFTFLLLIWIPINQFCCPIPCAHLLTHIFYFAGVICTILIWFVYVNDACLSLSDTDVVDASCEVSTAGWINVLASLFYVIAWLLHCLLPTPKEAQLARELNKAQKETKEANERAKEAEDKLEEAESKLKDMGASDAAEKV